MNASKITVAIFYAILLRIIERDLRQSWKICIYAHKAEYCQYKQEHGSKKLLASDKNNGTSSLPVEVGQGYPPIQMAQRRKG